MELKDLLAVQSPTLGQYAEMEKQLLAIARKAKDEVERLDAEGRARGADRLVGKDDGSAERAVARAEAEQRRGDAENVLSEVRGKAAALEARLAKEADVRAWNEVRALLDARVKAMQEIEALCSRIGELYGTVISKGAEAQAKAPAKPNYRDGGFNNLPGRMPAQVGLAILAKLHTALDNPFVHTAVSNAQFSETYARQVGIHGLAGFLGPVHNAILLNDV